MINRRAAVFVLVGAVILLLMAACGRKENPSAEVSSIISYSSEPETTTVPSVSETKAATTETEPQTTEEPAETEPAEVMTLFMGRPAADPVQKVNERTLQDPASGICDVLKSNKFTYGAVIQMIESYGMPKKNLYGGAAFTDETRSMLYAMRNLDELRQHGSSEKKEIRYGILTDNADVRSYPTMSAATDTDGDKEFDGFQESMLPLASGVLILHQTADGAWSFVQGYNYYGWIRTETIGFTDADSFRKYLTGDDFIVTLVASLPVGGKDLRLGTVIPYEYAGNDEFLLLFPERAEDGTFKTTSVPLSDNGLASDGYLPWSQELLLMVASNLIGTPYGWGDTAGNYDCSSTIGLLYRCFGIYLPRNTSAMSHFGGTVLDVSSLTAEEKLKRMEEHPGAVLLMPGHAMLYSSVYYKNNEGTEADHFVIHNTSGFYTDETAENLSEIYSVTESALENMFRANGESFTDRIQTILLFEENTAEEAE